MRTKKLFAILIAFLIIGVAFNKATPPSADAVLKEALTQAKKEKKHVFIIFHASWCGWCHKMDESMNDPEIKDLFDRNYVIKHLVVMESEGKKDLENPGGMEMIKKYNSEGFGIPLWLVFNAKGELQADSHIRPEGTGFEVKGKSIIGCPASEPEVKEFIKVLKKTSDLNDKELDKIAKRFRKNDPAFK